MPFFSIIIPTHNSEKTLQKCLESIINQTFNDFEILIMDNISTDNTLNIVKNFNDNRIKIFAEKDKGIYDAMNRGIGVSEGEWLYFIGSDDRLYDNDVLTKIYTEISLNDCDFIYGNVLRFPSNVVYDGQFDLKKLFNNPVCHQAIFTKKKLFEEIGNFNIRYKSLADHDFVVQVFAKNDSKIRYIPLLIAYFQDGGFSSTYNDIKFMEDYREKYTPFKRVISRKTLYSSLWRLFYYYCKKEKWAKAFKLFFVISINERSKCKSFRAIKFLLKKILLFKKN
jgi:glycosyltransferase involved in cell wall biosynthesis